MQKTNPETYLKDYKGKPVAGGFCEYCRESHHASNPDMSR